MTPVSGFTALLRGFPLLLKPGLRHFLWLPLIVNTVLLILIGWAATSYFDAALNHLLPEDSWLSFLRWLLWPLFAVAYGLFVFYGFTAIANIIASPFNSLLAARVEELLTGKPPVDDRGILASILPSLLSELRKWGYFLLRAVPILLLLLVPGINVIASVLWLVLGFWFLTIEYIDYPMGNHGMSFPEQRQRLSQRPMLTLGFGAGVSLVMFVPLLNLAAMPAAVAGATLLWVERFAPADRQISPADNP